MSRASATRERPAPPPTEAPPASRPIFLVTIDTVFAPEAIAFALDATADARGELVVCHCIPIAGNPAATRGRTLGDLGVRSEVAEVVAQARARGLSASAVMLSNRRPLVAIANAANEARTTLFVFGVEARAYGRFRYRRHVARLRRVLDCHLWPVA